MKTTHRHHRHCDIEVRQHTRERMAERTDTDQLIPFERAWERGLKVENPVSWASDARLYEPYKLLLVVTWKTSDTVLKVDYSKLNTDGLVKCDNCELLTDPWLDTSSCHWCGEELGGVRADGCMVIRRAGGE